MKAVFLVLACFITHLAAAQTVPLPHAHAHNDYHQPRPLLDALAHGFTSVEADVLLIQDELYVGHDMPEGVHQLPTLREAYLEPLRRIVHNRRGKVYPDYEGHFYLMLDIKTDAEATYAVLKTQLEEYKEMLSRYSDGQIQQGAVTVFLSGNRPIQTVQQEKSRLVGIDGRPGDLGKDYPPELMPVVSQHYFQVIQWDGKGAIPAQEFQTLSALAAKVHLEGKKLRLWASPENENVWKTLRRAEVDLINTDDLAGLRTYLLEEYANVKDD